MNSNKRARESQNVYLGNKKMEDISESSNESIDFADALNRVNEKEMMDLLECPLCTNVHKEVTLISKCLHRFCTECIRQRLREDGTRSCPVCHIDLGCNPEQYLRHDKDVGLFARTLLDCFRLKKGMQANSHDDKLEPDQATGVQAVPQDTETSHDHGKDTRNENDDPATLEPEASRVQVVPQDTETSHDHDDKDTRKENDPAALDESKYVPEERTTSEMMTRAFGKVYTKRAKKN